MTTLCFVFYYLLGHRKLQLSQDKNQYQEEHRIVVVAGEEVWERRIFRFGHRDLSVISRIPNGDCCRRSEQLDTHSKTQEYNILEATASFSL
jgi:hypothetical protein